MTLSQRIIAGRIYLEKVLSKADMRCLHQLAQCKVAYCFLTGLKTMESRSEQEAWSVSLALGALGLLGLRPVSYRNEYDGHLIHDIMPRPGQERDPSSSGRVTLPFHTDMAFLRFGGEVSHPFKAAAPDFLVLAGITNESRVPTKLITVDEILDGLSDDDIRVLSDPNFSVRSPKTVYPPKNAVDVPLLLDHHDYGRLFRYNGGAGVVTPKDVAEPGFENLFRSISRTDIGHEFDIQPGTILIFNNRKVVHGRGAIGSDSSTADDAPERHFKRVYGQLIETDCYPLFPNNPFMQGLGG